MRIENIKLLKKLIEKNEIKSHFFQVKFNTKENKLSGKVILHLVTNSNEKLKFIITNQLYQEITINSLEYKKAKKSADNFKEQEEYFCILMLELMNSVKFYDLVDFKNIDLTYFKNTPRFIKKVIKKSFEKKINLKVDNLININ